MRLVLDTNVALSGLLWGRGPGQLIDAAIAHRIELASSTALLAELQGVLSREKFASQLARRGLTVEGVFNGYISLVVSVTPLVVPRVIERDPDDDHVIVCALASRADAIVSGDRDLLEFRVHQNIDILTAAEASRASGNHLLGYQPSLSSYARSVQLRESHHHIFKAIRE